MSTNIVDRKPLSTERRERTMEKTITSADLAGDDWAGIVIDCKAGLRNFDLSWQARNESGDGDATVELWRSLRRLSDENLDTDDWRMQREGEVGEISDGADTGIRDIDTGGKLYLLRIDQPGTLILQVAA